MKLKSVFDIIAHWAIDLLKKKVRELATATSFCKDASEAKDALLDHARPLTALIGMLTSQCHIGRSCALESLATSLRSISCPCCSLSP